MASNQSVMNDGNDVAVIKGLLAQTLLTDSGVDEDQEQIESQSSASASASAPTVTAATDDSVAAPVRQKQGPLPYTLFACCFFAEFPTCGNKTSQGISIIMTAL